MFRIWKLCFYFAMTTPLRCGGVKQRSKSSGQMQNVCCGCGRHGALRPRGALICTTAQGIAQVDQHIDQILKKFDRGCAAMCGVSTTFGKLNSSSSPRPGNS